MKKNTTNDQFMNMVEAMEKDLEMKLTAVRTMRSAFATAAPARPARPARIRQRTPAAGAAAAPQAGARGHDNVTPPEPKVSEPTAADRILLVLPEGAALSAAEVMKAVMEAGHAGTEGSVRVALKRLTETGGLKKSKDKRYSKVAPKA